MVVTRFYLYTKNKTVVNTDGTTTNNSVSFRDFFPFTSPKVDTTKNDDIIPVPDFNQEENAPTETPKLKKIFDGAVAGIAIITKDEGIKPNTKKVEYLRFVERESGHVDEIELQDYKITKLTDVTIPKIVEAQFATNGESVIMRFVNDDDNQTIRTYLAKLTLNTDSNTDITYTPYKLSGAFLPDNIITVSVSPSTNKIFYLFPYKESVIGNILDLTTNKKIQNLDTNFHSFLSEFSGEDGVTLTTKASYLAPGFSYNINKIGEWNKIIGNIYGMTTKNSPNGKNIAFSSYGNNGLSLSLLNTTTGATVRAPANTLSEKCSWANDNITLYCAVPNSIPGANYPDAWYQGLVSFSDSIWKITQDGNGSMIESLQNIDATNVIPNLDQSKLFFVNNKDKSVWELDI